jgi:hypothetical protein
MSVTVSTPSPTESPISPLILFVAVTWQCADIRDMDETIMSVTACSTVYMLERLLKLSSNKQHLSLVLVRHV